jgi:VanZ family protein
MRLTRYIFLFGTAMICLTIFFFSAQNIKKSGTVSGKVASEIQSGAEVVIKEENSLKLFKKVFIKHTRKWAHVVLYFVMGIMLCGYLSYGNMRMRDKIILVVIICFLYGCTDEIHQIFSDGRGSRFTDVLIDTAGASVGTLLTAVAARKANK